MRHVSVYYQGRNGSWIPAGSFLDKELSFADKNVTINVSCSVENGNITNYSLNFSSSYPTRIRLEMANTGRNLWHLIPCCIHGDNALKHARPDQYPNLTEEYPEAAYSSPFWEFRADRASHPVSMLEGEAGLCAISINPYTKADDGTLIRNGVFAELPNLCGVTVGYANVPFTFVNKRCDHDPGFSKSTSDPFCGGTVSGKIFFYPDENRMAVKKVIETLYRQYRERPRFKKSFQEAAQAIIDGFISQNWSDEFGHYTNQQANPPRQPELRPWRALLEIGWTGGSILAYPFIVAEKQLGLPTDYFAGKKSGYKLFDEIVGGYNPAGGFFFDLVRELNGSRVNGWWDFLKITHDLHSAYTNGHALYYLFRAMKYLRDNSLPVPEPWRQSAMNVAENLLELQREDGCCGFSFHTDRREVASFDGFTGCWPAAALTAAYRFNKDERFLKAAVRAADYYFAYVKDLNVFGTPMDTWMAPDQEGNLAFMKLARYLHEASGDKKYLDMLEEAAHYEYLWRYGFKAVPEIMPLKGSRWNSCGGSVTSVSNPHIHPMGVLVTQELYYLAEHTGNDVHRMRADDGVAWLMNCLELYPEISGYGKYGVTTERFCPSDGLTDYRYSDGRPASMWYSYNGWAAANALEALLYMLGNTHRFEN